MELRTARSLALPMTLAVPPVRRTTLPAASFIKARKAVVLMPYELTSKEQFKELLKQADEVRVVKDNGTAKVKIRTKKGLYTFKTTGDEADSLVKGIKAPVVEF